MSRTSGLTAATLTVQLSGEKQNQEGIAVSPGRRVGIHLPALGIMYLLAEHIWVSGMVGSQPCQGAHQDLSQCNFQLFVKQLFQYNL